MADEAPVIAICHGGGPLPALGDTSHAPLIRSMQTRIPLLLGVSDQNPHGVYKGIVMVTAHWSETNPTISNAKTPPLYYDYGGFPDAAYQLHYDAPGSPEIAALVHAHLAKAGFAPEMDGERGWDHGVFIPMLVIHPRATIPIIQVSLIHSTSTRQHYDFGKALAPLRSQGIVIIGSGMPTFHNLRGLFRGNYSTGEKHAAIAQNRVFSHQLTRVLEMSDEEQKVAELQRWRQWDGALEAHPQGGEEHFWPVIVCAGAGARRRGDGNLGSEGNADAEGGMAKWWGDIVDLKGWCMEQRSYYWD